MSKPKFSKSHYKIIVESLAESYNRGLLTDTRVLKVFAQRLSEDNPRFDYAKFLNYFYKLTNERG